jgi:hypothetical protein
MSEYFIDIFYLVLLGIDVLDTKVSFQALERFEVILIEPKEL